MRDTGGLAFFQRQDHRIFSGRSRGVELGEEDRRWDAGEDTDASICEEHAPDACCGIRVAVDEREIGHGDVGGGSKEREGSGS